MKANNSLRINMPRALELISFFFLGHGPTYLISDLSGSAIMRGNCTYICEKTFSVINFNKSKSRLALTDEYLQSILLVSTAHYTPRYEKLAGVKSQMHTLY